MDNPNQHLIHLTSRGPKVFGQDGAVGKFKCVTSQPIKDVNKFGMLHYSIPKALDTVTDYNNRFTLRLRFHKADARGRSVIDVPVTLPQLDYYNMLVSSGGYDKTRVDGPQRTFVDKAFNANYQQQRNKGRLHFDEVLQVSINWALMNEFDYYDGGGANPEGTVAQQMLARISCICNFDEEKGIYQFHIGYRGHNDLENNDDPTTRGYKSGVKKNTGCPWPCQASEDVADDPIEESQTGAYTFRSPEGTFRANNDPCFDAVNNAYDDDLIDQSLLTGFEFRNVPLRLQLMMGLGGADVGSNYSEPPDTVRTRGRIRLVNYTGEDDNGPYSSGLYTLDATIAPNLDPPSMLYLQLTVPGTRSKILGQSDERGGWAIPTPSNAFISQRDSMPHGPEYNKLDQMRYMPYVSAADTQAEFLTRLYAHYANNAGAALAPARKIRCFDGLGYNYDPIPLHGTTVPAAPAVRVAPVDDYDLDNCTFIKFHRKATFVRRMRAGARNTKGGPQSAGFGAGADRVSPVFTTSMIEPNYIYTQTTDSTIQTFDVQLLWGDTSEPVHNYTGQPVQFSIIASS